MVPSGKKDLHGWCRGRKVKGAIGQRRPRVDSVGGRQVKGAIEQRRPCIDVVEGRGKMCYQAKETSHG